MRDPSPPAEPSRVATGIAGLDDVLGGGFTPHRLYLIEGDPGAGKTTLGLQYLLEGHRNGEAGLYVTLSETTEELQAVARSHGWSLDGIRVCELAPAEEALDPDAQLTMFHASETELGETTRRVLAEVEQGKPTRVVFDSLSELRLLTQNSLRYRRQFLALKQFFIGRQCTVLLLDDRTAEGSDLQLRSLAHGVIYLEQLPPEYGAERRRLRVLKMREVCFRGGYHDYTIETGGLRVFPRLVASEHHRPFPPGRVESGVAALDQLLSGGLDRGSSTLVMGPAGCGKSSLATQYVVTAAARGEPAAMFLFEEDQRKLLERAAGLGLDLRGQVDAGRVRLQHVNPAELSPGEFAHAVRRAVEQDGARVVVIDSLSGYLNAMPEERFLVLHLHELFAYLNQRGVTTLMVVAQYGLIGPNMHNPVDVSYLADKLILLRYFEASGRLRRAISVLKRREGAHEDAIRELTLGADGLVVGAPLTEFQGILSGTPTFTGPGGQLREKS